MKALIKINLLQIWNLKSLLIGVLILMTNSLVHVTELPPSDKAPLQDMIIASLGGIFVHDSVWDLLAWVSVVGVTFFFVYTIVFVPVEEFDLLTLPRAGSRLRWWAGKVLSVGIFTFLYVLVCFLVTSIVGELSVRAVGWAYTAAAKVVLVFWLGLFCNGMLVFTLAVLFRHPNSIFVSWTVVCFVLGEAYVLGKVPGSLSPIAFPAIRSIGSHGNYTWSSVMARGVFLLISALTCVGVGIIRVRNIDFDSLLG